MTKPLLIAGDEAPDFQLPTSAGGTFHLYETLRHSPVVLFFYVKAFTPLCISEVCSFRDRFEEFREANAAVFGISPDSGALTRRFAGFFSLPFPLLLDAEHTVRKLYGLPKILGFLSGRATFVVGRSRRIEHVTYPTFQSAPHVIESFRAIQDRTKCPCDAPNAVQTIIPSE